MSDIVYNLAVCENGGTGGCKDGTCRAHSWRTKVSPRFPWSVDDMNLVKNSIAFTILSDGIPIICQGQEQHLEGADAPECLRSDWVD